MAQSFLYIERCNEEKNDRNIRAQISLAQVNIARHEPGRSPLDLKYWLRISL
jgi:hypothetical protein